MIYNGNNIEVLKSFEDNSIDSIVTDPPYGLSFMNKHWDYEVPKVELWRECFRVLKPGGHLLSFAGTRTYHRMTVNIEDAGFEIRDMISWIYGSGFPKSLDIGKAIDKRGGNNIGWFGEWLKDWRVKNKISQKEISKLFPSKTGGLTGCVANWELGLNIPTAEQFSKIVTEFDLPFKTIEEAEREIIGKGKSGIGTAIKNGEWSGLPAEEFNLTAPATPEAIQWNGWGTALKPACEPICVARKPVEGTIAGNVLQYGTGGINIDGCRIGENGARFNGRNVDSDIYGKYGTEKKKEIYNYGRFPANIIFDEIGGVMLDEQSKDTVHSAGGPRQRTVTSEYNNSSYHAPKTRQMNRFDDTNFTGASRFFYCAKASKAERNGGLEGFEEKFSPTMNNGIGGKEHDPETATKKTNHHPTVKPLKLMQYLVRLVTPPNGICLDPFCGSGTTLMACVKEGFNYIGIERETEYVKIAEARIEWIKKQKEKEEIEQPNLFQCQHS